MLAGDQTCLLHMTCSVWTVLPSLAGGLGAAGSSPRSLEAPQLQAALHPPTGAGPSPPPWAVLATTPLPATRGSTGLHPVDCLQ